MEGRCRGEDVGKEEILRFIDKSGKVSFRAGNFLWFDCQGRNATGDMLVMIVIERGIS